MDTSDSSDIAAAFAEITRAVASADDLEQVLARIGRLAVLTVDGCDDASVTIRERGGRLRTAGPTSVRSTEVDRAQYELGEGPCLSAIADGADCDVADLASDERWPRFAVRARGLGVGSVLSFQLSDPGDGDGRGGIASLNLYGDRAGAFTDEDRGVGRIYAAHASIALATARAAARLARHEADLRDALANRDIIGQAKGILMERHRLTAGEAFDRLRETSQRLNVKLRQVAQDVADTGQLPGGFEPAQRGDAGVHG